MKLLTNLHLATLAARSTCWHEVRLVAFGQQPEAQGQQETQQQTPPENPQQQQAQAITQAGQANTASQVADTMNAGAEEQDAEATGAEQPQVHHTLPQGAPGTVEDSRPGLYKNEDSKRYWRTEEAKTAAEMTTSVVTPAAAVGAGAVSAAPVISALGTQAAMAPAALAGGAFLAPFAGYQVGKSLGHPVLGATTGTAAAGALGATAYYAPQALGMTAATAKLGLAASSAAWPALAALYGWRKGQKTGRPYWEASKYAGISAIGTSTLNAGLAATLAAPTGATFASTAATAANASLAAAGSTLATIGGGALGAAAVGGGLYGLGRAHEYLWDVESKSVARSMMCAPLAVGSIPLKPFEYLAKKWYGDHREAWHTRWLAQSEHPTLARALFIASSPVAVLGKAPELAWRYGPWSILRRIPGMWTGKPAENEKGMLPSVGRLIEPITTAPAKIIRGSGNKVRQFWNYMWADNGGGRSNNTPDDGTDASPKSESKKSSSADTSSAAAAAAAAA